MTELPKVDGWYYNKNLYFCVSEKTNATYGRKQIRLPCETDRHLRFEQHHRQVLELPACAALYLQNRRRVGRLWHCHELVCLHRTAPRHPHFWYGNHLFPLLQQGRREPRQGLFHVGIGGGFGEFGFRRFGQPFPEADFQRLALRQPSRICRNYGHHRGLGRISGHTFRPLEIRKQGHQVCRAQTAVHLPQYRLEPVRFLSWSHPV